MRHTRVVNKRLVSDAQIKSKKKTKSSTKVE